MIEFDEFVSIVRGGSSSSAGKEEGSGTAAIYKFFKDLTEKKIDKLKRGMMP